jgi:hypothetical protein
MPKRWSCRAASALPALATLAALLAPAAALPAQAATILQKTVEIEIGGDGTVVERMHLEIRLEAATDFASWSPFPVAIDERRSLNRFAAWVRRPDGTTEKVGREGFDTVDAAEEWLLSSSAKVRLVNFPQAPVGAVLSLEYETLAHPYFPAGSLALGAADAISRLSVRVRGGAGRRWSIAGPTSGLQVVDTPSELRIIATDLPRAPLLEDVPDEVRHGPELRYGWGPDASWGAVGRWYDEIARGLPRGGDEIHQTSRRILSGLSANPGAPVGNPVAHPTTADPRRRLESLLAFLRRDVRYVAVEVGVGGYRPAAPRDTLARRWGDCKGKVMLLLDLLAEAGIQGFPALVLAAPAGRIDPDFPTPTVFDHMIAALPIAGLPLAAGDPVAGGYLFVDPTQTEGGIGWLYPADQDQLALVLRGDRSELVRTPMMPQLETFQLTIELEVKPEGTALGQVRLELRGAGAAAYSRRLTEERPEQIEADGRRMIAAWFPDAAISTPRWLADREAEIPVVTLTAGVVVRSLVGFGEAVPEAGGAPAPARSIALPGARVTPAPGLLRDRSAPVVLRPQVASSTWRLKLPAGWCPAQSDRSGLDNTAGAFHQTVTCAGDQLLVERRTELRRRWVEPAELSALSDLALAEHRTTARRLRLDRLHS